MRGAEKLIAAVEKRPVLYDQSYRCLRDEVTLGSKSKVWMEIAREVYGRKDKDTVNLTKSRWKSLRDSFVKHQRRCETSNTTVKPYAYETQMEFLLPHILTREREDYQLTLKTADLGDSPGQAEESVKQEFDLDVVDEPLVKREFNLEDEPVVKRKFKLETEPSPSKDDMDGSVHPVDAFFHGVAQTVKRLKPATVAKVKKAVANVVMDAEIAELQDADS